jgi:hypothetical protein
MGGGDAGDLYALPLDRFVPERAALAKTLRQDGRRDEAAGVAARRKPSVGAWAVNQLVRTQRAGIDRLFAAGDAVRRAQAELLEGRGDARALRTAAEAERAAVADLIETARGLLTSGGHELSPAVLDRVADTLHAAGLDPDARDQLRDGCLERELVHVGLGGLAPAPPAPPGSKRDPEPAADAPRPPAADPAETQRRERPARAVDPAETQRRERAARAEDRAEAKRIDRERAAAHREARAAEAAARKRVDRAERAVRAAEERRDQAAQKLSQADEALAVARAEAKAAAEAHDRARAERDPE